MLDKLAIVDRVIAEHQTIGQNIKLVGDSVSDEEALKSLEGARADWIPGRLEAVSEKQKRLQQTMNALDEGLRRHFAFEEKALPPLLGELLMQSLILEHREIKGKIDEAKSIAADTELEELSRDELLSEETHMQHMVTHIRQLVEEHAAKEEAVLAMVQRALEEGK